MNHQGNRSTCSRRGFTLVELSIVLVILGLLIGGVLTGQTLIRAAELRSVTTQEQRYVAAVQTFRDKYFALPGDMTNAQSYWGVQDATAATCLTSASTDSKTCNGNGDGQIVQSTGSNEYFRFWQHLANAGLIEGSYNGVKSGTAAYSATTANSPSGRISGSIWFAAWGGAMSGGPDYFDGDYANYLEIGTIRSNTLPFSPLFKPEEAYNIDMKVDDGQPATGSLVIHDVNVVTNCTDGTNYTSLSANYKLTNTALACALMFRRVF